MPFIEKAVDVPVVAQRQIRMNRKVQKTTEIPQLQYIDDVVGVPVVSVVQAPLVRAVMRTVETPRVKIVAETTEIPQLPLVEKIVMIPEIQTIQGPQTSESLSVDSRRLSHQDCEVLFHVSKQSPDIAGGVHVDRNNLHAGNGDLWWSCSDGEAQVTGVPVVTRTAVAAQHRSTQQHKQEQRTEQAMQEGERDQGEEGEKGQEERERGERGKREEGRDVEEDVTGWTEVTRSKKHRKRTVQIFVNVDGSKVTPMEVSLTDDKVEDVMKRIQKDEDDNTRKSAEKKREAGELRSN